MIGINTGLPIDALIDNTNEQNTPSTYIEKWKSRIKEAFGIATANTKWRRDMDKRKRDQEARLQHLEVGSRVLVRKLNGRGSLVKQEGFGKRKCIKFFKGI